MCGRNNAQPFYNFRNKFSYNFERSDPQTECPRGGKTFPMGLRDSRETEKAFGRLRGSSASEEREINKITFLFT